MAAQEKKRTLVLDSEVLSVLCYQLGLMLKAGIGSEEAVEALREDVADPKIGAVLKELQGSLLDGAPLSVALKNSGAFPAYMIRMVEIGQAAGRLDEVLSALAGFYRREADTASAIRRAILYPAVMAVLVAAVFLILMVRVLPVFQQVFTQLGVSLSPVAQGLLQAGQVGKYVAAVVVVLLGVGALALLYFSRQTGRSARVLETKFLGKGAAGIAVDRSRFASAMALMLSSGLQLDEAMERTILLLENSVLTPRLQACKALMDQGSDFSKAIMASKVIDGMQAGLLGAGFRAGVPEQAMEELAERCQDEADGRLGRRLSRLELILVVVLCVSVGLVLLSVMLPLLGVLSAIG